MADGRLTFIEDGHVYKIDGEEAPGVSQIIRFLSREAYGAIDDHTLGRAAARGTAVHKAAEQLDRAGRVEIDGDLAGYLNAYADFLRGHAVRWEDIERAMYHPGRRYAGTIDRFGYVDGAPALLDIKTSAAIHKPLVKAQLNGYEDMRRANGMTAAERLYCLQLMGNGRYRLYPCAIDMTEFNACYALHHALERKQEKGRIL